jgi:hypothetical protein
MNVKRIRFAWKHRRALWKYRKLLIHRNKIAAATAAGAAILASVLLYRGART